MDYNNYPNPNYGNQGYGYGYNNASPNYMHQQPNIYQRCNMFFASGAFLVATILYTVAVVSNFAFNTYCLFAGRGLFYVQGAVHPLQLENMIYYGNTLAYMVPELLLIIFLFVAHSLARRNALAWNHVRNISGAVMVHVILVIIYAVLFIAAAVLMVFVVITDRDFVRGYSNMHNALNIIFGTFFSMFLAVFIALCIILGVLCLVFALCGFNGIRKFARSVYKSMQTGNEFIVKKTAAKGWLITFGIFALIWSFSGISTSLYANMVYALHFPIFVLRGVAYIMFGVLIGKYAKGCITR